MADAVIEDQAGFGTRTQRRGWYIYGWASHVFPTLVTTVFMSRYLTSVAEHAVGKHGRLHILGVPIAPGSLFVYVVTTATVLLIGLMPLVGAIADRTGAKRAIMLGCGWAGATCCVLMFFVRGGNWQLGAVLYAASFIFYSCAVVVYYSLLVDLSSPADRDRLSSVGWGVSYLGGGILLAVAFVASLALDKSTLARTALAVSGLWWAGFNVLAWRNLAGLPRRTTPVTDGSVLAAGFRQLGRTIGHLRNFPLTLAFLGAFLIYNDGIQTVTTVAAVYGDKELGLSDTVLLLAILLVQFVAFAGAVWLGRLAGRFGAKRVVLGSLLVWLGVIGAAYLLQRDNPAQFFALATVLALVLGGSQALSRAMFSRMIPPGSEAEYFGFYEISDSGTSWLGPLLFGVVNQLTGSYRSALVSLVLFFVLGFIALAAVPVRRAIEASGNVAPARV
jgi:UMF1 family MFS transporter